MLLRVSDGGGTYSWSSSGKVHRERSIDVGGRNTGARTASAGVSLGPIGRAPLGGIGPRLCSEIQEFAVKRIALQKQFRLQRDADRDLGKSITPTALPHFATLVMVR